MIHLFMCNSFNNVGNDSKVEGLVNFEKLRMIAKEIRHVGRMASVNMDPALMFRTRWGYFELNRIYIERQLDWNYYQWKLVCFAVSLSMRPKYYSCGCS